MPGSSDNVVKVISAGVNVGSVSAAERTSDGLIRIGHALIARGIQPRFVNCQSLSSDGVIKVHHGLGGNVIFEGL